MRNTNYYNYYRVVVTNRSYYDGNNAYWILGEIECVGTQRIKNISTEEDYDIYEDVEKEVIKTPNEIERKYYKYIYNSWTQPVLSSNGIIGGNSFAVTASSYYDSPRQPFNAFDGQNAAESNCWHAASGFPQWLEWYSPEPLKYSNIKILNRTNNGNAIKDYQIQISDDGNNWETILTGTNTVSDAASEWNINLSSIQPITKYMRIYITTGYDSNYVVIGEVTITAQQQSTTGGTSSDYDFYEDITHTRVYRSF